LERQLLPKLDSAKNPSDEPKIGQAISTGQKHSRLKPAIKGKNQMRTQSHEKINSFDHA